MFQRRVNSQRHITVLVSNDVQFDQRVAKTCDSLRAQGWTITRIGRLLPDSQPFECPDEVKRFSLLFHRGALFYAALNVRLFWYLLFAKTDALWANDLDTLLPAFLIGKLRRKPLMYDSHEYFTEAEGLSGRKFQKWVWCALERWMFPRLAMAITVNESIAAIYRKKYNVPVHVLRNVPKALVELGDQQTVSPFGWPDGKLRVLLQGAYIDPDRGGMEAVEAMQLLPEAHLLIVGSGRDLDNMKQRVHDLHLSTRVAFLPRLPRAQLLAITRTAHIGLSLDKPLHLNYTLSLPNKLFDYIQAGVPVLVSSLPEVQRIVLSYEVGEVIDAVTPEGVARGIQGMQSSGKMEQYRRNTHAAAAQLTWEQEWAGISRRLHEILR